MLSFSLFDFQEGRDPDYSEYKEFKLTVENLGFRMLMKMGWKEGEGLGSEGQGIKAPVNKWASILFIFTLYWNGCNNNTDFIMLEYEQCPYKHLFLNQCIKMY